MTKTSTIIVCAHLHITRLCELAKPIIRDTMDNLQFNPDAFNVKPNAKHAKASARIEELAQPIQRGGL